MKKRTFTVLTLFILTLSLLLSSCQGAAEPEEPVSTTPSVTASRMMFDKDLWEISEESAELDIEIQPPYQYREYTLEDFAPYGVKDMKELDSYKRNGHVIRCFKLYFKETKSIEELKEIQQALAQRKDIYRVRVESGYRLDTIPDDYNSVD